MNFLYATHLILAGLMGIHSNIVTVSKVSVKAGGSISIPCLYEQKYEDNVKYLCKGDIWLSCKPAVKTDKPDDSGKFLIADDRKQRIFTVTINELQVTDTDTYWCVVEKKGWDVKKGFELSVTGVPSLSVDQQNVTAFEGGSVTIKCCFQNPKVTEWCRLNVNGNTCVKRSGLIDGMKVTINTKVQKVFTVTMSGLMTENSGWYWCAKRDLQMPVHITVLKSTSTTTTRMSPTTASFTETFPTTTQHSSLLTSAEPHTLQPTNSSINGSSGGSQHGEKKSSTMVTVLISILVLLLLVVPAAIFGWRMMIKHNQTKPDITVGSHNGSDPDVQYATIVHNKHAAAQQKQDEETSVTYSSIVMKESVRQMPEPADVSVIYSTVHKQKK